MKYFGFLVLAASAGLFALGCTKPDTTAPSTGSNATSAVDEHGDHDHEGHTHEGEENAEAAGDEFGAAPSEPEISLDSAAPAEPAEGDAEANQ